MNSVDYSKQLNQARSNFTRRVDERSRNHAEETADLKETTDYKIKNQSKAHKKELLDKEVKFQDRVSSIDRSQQEALEKKSDAYMAATQKYKDEVSKDKQENLRIWRNKFDNLKHDFKDTNANQKEYDEQVREDIKLGHQRDIAKIRKDASNNFDEYIKNTVGDKDGLKEKINAEKNQLVRNHKNEKHELVKGEIDKRNILKTKISRDVQNLKETSEKALIDNRTIADARFKDLSHNTNKEVEGLRNKFNATAKDMQDSQKNEVRKQNLQFTQRFYDQEKRNTRSIRDLEFQTKAQGLNSGGVSHTMREQQIENLNHQHSIQKGRLADERNSLVNKYEETIKKQHTNIQDLYRDQKVDQAEKTAEMKNDMLAENKKDKQTRQIEKEKLSHEFNLSNKHTKMSNESNVNSIKAANTLEVKNLKRAFNDNMNLSQRRLEENYERVKQENESEKQEFKMKVAERNSEQNFAMKNMYDQKINKMTEGYERKIADLENTNKRVVEEMSDKIGNIRRNNQAEQAKQNAAFKKSAETSIQTERAISGEKQNQLRKQISDIQTGFNDKMNKSKAEGERKNKNLAFKYEAELTSERKKYNGIIDQNKKFFDREFLRLKLASDDGRERLISQYEDRIQKLQEVFHAKELEKEQFNKINNA